MPKAYTTEQKKEKVMERVEQRNESRPARQRRSSFNGTRQKLSVNSQIPGYHLHIFNDNKDGRIQQALDSGYEFVAPEEVGVVTSNVTSHNTDLGDRVRYLVGTDNGEPLYAYLMKIKQEWYEEDQKELQARNDRTDAAIRKGQIAGTSGDEFYNAGIKMDK